MTAVADRLLARQNPMGVMSARREPKKSNESRRAERFPIKVPVQYRALGENEWHVGASENISSTGIFFLCSQSAELHEHVEIDFVLRGGQFLATHVVCLGHIVRAERKQQNSELHAFAARIESYHLLPGEIR